MLLDAFGKPYTEVDILPNKRIPCQRCGSIASRNVYKGFSRHWRLTCQQCGLELASGRGELPEGEV
jgi:hypothetical protein